MLYAKWNNITYHVACGKLKMDAINLKATIKELWLMSEKEEIKWNCKKNSVNPKEGKKRRKWEQRTNGTGNK